MALYVIADLHLSAENKRLCSAFAAFLNKLQKGDRLIISGDFFNFFVGIDPSDSCQKFIKQTLLSAKQRNIDVFFQHGNRDFLISQKDAEFFNFTLLPEIYVDETGPEPCLIMHGDNLCSNDEKYQKFKSITKKKWIRNLFFMLPLFIRKKIAVKLRDDSQKLTTIGRDPLIYGLVPATIEKFLADNNCAIIIHGHLHQYGLHYSETPHEKQRLALGDWGEFYSFVKIDGNGFYLLRYPIDELFR
ncbi:UDP-2,3-diacylglucosamine diphosphatase [Succinatimonas hippei]|uniref:UDP-2,3-diacylglucosamine diphosphatase n=1 Tax=Succinatimonas hippei TaxID=626938 RepID=UPI002492D903|nr:UDP-2,3-diacylglucosamine diphosphatase [Succinatimonas hippei]